jgi:hypothetical protein
MKAFLRKEEGFFIGLIASPQPFSEGEGLKRKRNLEPSPLERAG